MRSASATFVAPSLTPRWMSCTTALTWCVRSASARPSDSARAAAALPAPTFLPGGERSVARLGELGPLPQAANATALAARQVERLDAEGGWNGSRPDETGGSQITTFGLGSNQGLGY